MMRFGTGMLRWSTGMLTRVRAWHPAKSCALGVGAVGAVASVRVPWPRLRGHAFCPQLICVAMHFVDNQLV